MRLLIAGDTHGNAPFVCDYLYPLAAELACDAIVQVGDFGYWEHVPDDDFLDTVNSAGQSCGIPLYWLRGNHDNVKHCLTRYGQNRDDGFVVCREYLRHIPDGHVWTWGGHRLRAFGGAYSIDKKWRLDREETLYRQAASREQHRRTAGRPAQPVPRTAGTLWFPEEELTDADMSAFLADNDEPMDVVFSHDKPFTSHPRFFANWRAHPAAEANQQRLQRALEVHRPRLWVHGHLHLRYVDTVPVGTAWTTVAGLGCDDRAAGRFARPTDAWCVLELQDGKPIVRLDGRMASELLESGRKPETLTYPADNV